MANVLNYNIIGTISDDTNFSCLIAYDSKQDPNDLVLINQFSQYKENKEIFKTFFSYFSSSKKTTEMKNFFAIKDSFSVVFKFNRGTALKEKLDKNKSTLNYQARCKLLSSILMKIENLKSMPLEALLCIADIDNILVNDENEPKILYNFKKINEYKNAQKQDLFINLANIIEFVLHDEVSDKYNHNIKLIVDQCINQFYNSIPQLIVELEKAEKKPNNKNFITHIKEYISQDPKKFKTLTILGSVIICSVAIYLVANFLLFSKHQDTHNESFSIGNIVYTTDENENNNKHIDIIDPIDTESKSSDNLNYVVTADTGISSEDYIVQYGDTIASICSQNYSSQDFIQTIESFNNISDSQLVPGKIIKLPDETSVVAYISNS